MSRQCVTGEEAARWSPLSDHMYMLSKIFNAFKWFLDQICVISLTSKSFWTNISGVLRSFLRIRWGSHSLRRFFMTGTNLFNQNVWNHFKQCFNTEIFQNSDLLSGPLCKRLRFQKSSLVFRADSPGEAADWVAAVSQAIRFPPHHPRHLIYERVWSYSSLPSSL